MISDSTSDRSYLSKLRYVMRTEDASFTLTTLQGPGRRHSNTSRDDKNLKTIIFIASIRVSQWWCPDMQKCVQPHSGGTACTMELVAGPC